MSERQYEILNMDAVSMAAQIAGGNLSVFCK